jgi:hypothetical protein
MNVDEISYSNSAVKVGFEVLTAVTMSSVVFWAVTPGSAEKNYNPEVRIQHSKPFLSIPSQ